MPAQFEKTADALFSAIEAAVKRVEASGMNETSKASALRDLAAAFRHVRGGAQPGGVSVEK